MRGNARTTTRIGAYVASAGLAISGTILAVSPVEAAPAPEPAAQSADWLADQLDGGAFTGGFSQGLSIDAALALVTIGGHTAAVTGVRDALASQMTDYVSPQEYDYNLDPPVPTQVGHYANALGKAAHFAQRVGANPTSYGGHNLVTELEARVTTTPGPRLGRLADDSSYGDFANTLGQAYAANALTTAGSTLAGTVTDFLLQQQCSSGYFRQQFSAPGSAGQSCVEGTDKADPDATAIAVQQLSAQSSDPDVSAAVSRAKSWLTRQQRCDGSFGGGAGTEGSNANSTGLVASALGDSPAARQAAQWLKSVQVPQGAAAPLTAESGAVALSPATLASARVNGIRDAGTRDQFRRATVQAAPGLRWYSTDATPAPGLTAPAGYLRAGDRVNLVASGAAAGTVLCITGPGASAQTISMGGSWSLSVTLPAGTATRTYAVRDPFGHLTQRSLKVLGAKKLLVRTSKARVRRSRSIRATLVGLAPGEHASVFYKGTLVRTGVASPGGRFAAMVNVGRAKGKKRIVGYGLSGQRVGVTIVRVVR